MKFGTVWAMPSRWTFSVTPIFNFVASYCDGAKVIVDPFCGESKFATYGNDLGRGGIDADQFCEGLVVSGLQADVVIFDPPYSPRQISECYKSIGRKAGVADTQNAALYKRVREPLLKLLKPGGVALSFGWNSMGLGSGLSTVEILLVQHGGAHNDTICVAQRKPMEIFQ